jgi:SAM-dependent methyltransferase
VRKLRALMNFFLDMLHIEGKNPDTFSQLAENPGVSDIEVDGFSNLSEVTKNEINNLIHHQIIKKLKKGFILDIGCGTGRYLSLFKNDTEFNCIGVDLCEGSITRAQGNNPKALFYVVDITKNDHFVDEHANKVSLAYSYSVLEYMQTHQLHCLVKNARTLLMNGGYLNLFFPTATGFLDSFEHRNYRKHRVEKISSILRKYGFSIITAEIPEKLPNSGHILAMKP